MDDSGETRQRGMHHPVCHTKFMLAHVSAPAHHDQRYSKDCSQQRRLCRKSFAIEMVEEEPTGVDPLLLTQYYYPAARTE